MMRTTMARGRLIASVAAMAIALLALAPGAWSVARAQTAGTPTPTPTPTSTTVPAGEGSTTEPTSDTTLTVDPGTFAVDVTITYTPRADTSSTVGTPAAAQTMQAQLQILGVPPPPAVASGDSEIAEIFELDATQVGGGEIDESGFLKPVEISIDLTPEILALAGGNALNVTLQFFDEATGLWTPVSCAASGAALVCQLPHFSVWALIVAAAAPAPPPAPAPAPTGTGLLDDGESRSALPLVLAGVLAAGLVGGLGAKLALARRRTG